MCSCCNATDYGETQRHFFVRASEHLRITFWTGKFVKTPKIFANFEYVLMDGHKVSFDYFSILLKESNVFKLQLMECLLISRNKPILSKNNLLFLGTIKLIMTLLLDIYCYVCNLMSIHQYYTKL